MAISGEAVLTDVEAEVLRRLVDRAIKAELGKVLPFVLVLQRQDLTLDVVTNAARTDLVPAMLKVAAEATKEPSERGAGPS